MEEAYNTDSEGCGPSDNSSSQCNNDGVTDTEGSDDLIIEKL